MQTTIKTIDIQAREWFDKVNGNSYFSAQVTINYAMPDELTIYLPFQYGYGSQFEWASRAALISANIFTDNNYSIGEWCRMHNIILRSNIQRGCKKRDIVAFGLK